ISSSAHRSGMKPAEYTPARPPKSTQKSSRSLQDDCISAITLSSRRDPPFYHIYPSIAICRIGRLLIRLGWILLERPHRYLDGFFQLRVVALPAEVGIHLYLHIRRDALILDLPIAFQVVEGQARSGDSSAVDEFRVIINSHQAAPRPFSDQRTDSCLAEHPGHRI